MKSNSQSIQFERIKLKKKFTKEKKIKSMELTG